MENRTRYAAIVSAFVILIWMATAAEAQQDCPAGGGTAPNAGVSSSLEPVTSPGSSTTTPSISDIQSTSDRQRPAATSNSAASEAAARANRRRVGGTFGPAYFSARSRANLRSASATSSANGAASSNSASSARSGNASGRFGAAAGSLVGTKMNAERLQQIQIMHGNRAYRYAVAAEQKGRTQTAIAYYRRAAEVAPGTEYASKSTAAIARLAAPEQQE